MAGRNQIYMNNNGLLIVLSGPSGSGKDTVLEKLLKLDDNIVKSVSATTRPSRDGEIDGKDYFFVSEETFCNAISNKTLLEYAKYCGNYYGTSKKAVEKLLNSGKDVVLKIETEGARQIKEKCEDSLRIFILPTSMEVLADRLFNRGTEDKKSLESRLERAVDEIAYSLDYDYIVINDDADKCAQNIFSIINAEKFRVCRMKNIVNEVLNNAKTID